MHYQSTLALFTVTFLLAACKPFSVSLNDKTLYTPAPLLTDFRVADRNLQTCLDQTISDLRATRVEQIKSLNCSNAGISTLAGIEIFSAIESLNLADNALSDITPLQQLTRLQTLVLRNNRITEADTLLNLLHLLALDITGNPSFNCGLSAQLEKNLAAQKAQLLWPAQCFTNE